MRLGYLWVVMLILLSKRSLCQSGELLPIVTYGLFLGLSFFLGKSYSTVKGYYYQPGQCHEKCWILPPCSSFPSILMGNVLYFIVWPYWNNFCVYIKPKMRKSTIFLRSQFEGFSNISIVFQPLGKGFFVSLESMFPFSPRLQGSFKLNLVFKCVYSYIAGI